MDRIARMCTVSVFLALVACGGDDGTKAGSGTTSEGASTARGEEPARGEGALYQDRSDGPDDKAPKDDAACAGAAGRRSAECLENGSK